jgi:TatD DNase family protein
MLIDSHCHLTDKKFLNIDEAVRRAREVGVKKIIVPAVNLKNSKEIIELAKKHEEVYALVGIHPEYVQDVLNLKTQMLKLKDLIQNSSKIVGVGEIGLDFYWRQDNKKQQVELFKAQMELATEFKLPVVIHNRNADEEIREIIEKLNEVPSGQFHCWGGSREFLLWVLSKGFYVSFAGNITFAKAKNLRGLLKLVPKNRLVLETDSPYLTPKPIRGNQNEPKNVKILASFQAKLLDVAEETLITQTGKNTLCLFSDIV